MKKLLNINNSKVVSRNEKGFTLVELLVVIGILGILMVGALVALNPIARFNQAKDANARSGVDQVSAAVQSYYATNQAWPPDIATLVTSKELQATPKGPTGLPLIFNYNASTGVSVGFQSATGSGYFCWKSNGMGGNSASDACTAP